MPVGQPGARAGSDTQLGGHAGRGIRCRRVVAAEPDRASAQRQHGLQRLDDEGRHRPRRQRPEVQPGARGVADDGQPGPRRVDVEADVAVAVGVRAGAVVARLQAGDQTSFDDLGGQRVGQQVVAHRLRLAQHRPDPPPVLAPEVAAHALAQVGRLADVQDLVAVAAEQVHAGGARQVRRQLELGSLRVPGHRGERREVVEPEHAEPGRPFDEQVQQIGGGEGVVERPVRGAMIEAEARRQRAEPAVGHLVTHEAPGEGDGVDPHGVVTRVPGPLEGGAQEGDVEADVVPDQHGVARELEQRRQDRLDPRRRGDQGVGEPGEDGDDRRDRPARVDERLERAEALAAADLDGADLGDRVVGAVAAGRLQVEHAERDVGQRRAEVVEAALHRTRPNRRCHDEHETTNVRSCQTPVR